MDMREINQGVINEFRANEGRLSGPMEGAPILLLTTIGRRSGTAHTTPVGFIEADGRLAVAAANGGADQHPDWFMNLKGGRDLTVELPGMSGSATATIAAGAERTKLLEQLAAGLPGMADHIAATNREIPVVIFTEAG